MRPEIDDLDLMGAKDPKHLAGRKQRQMGERAKAAVADQNIVFGQIGMHVGDARHVVRAQRGAEHVQQEACAGVEQREQMHHRKAAAGRLTSWLSELFLQRRRVRHRNA